MRYIIILFSAFLLSSCNNSMPKQPSKENTMDSSSVQLSDIQIKNAELQIGSATMKNIASVLKVNGVIDVPPQNMVSVSFPLGGYLKSTNLLPGMHVNKNAVIAVMEDQQYIQLQQDYLTARARQQYLENEYTRQKELNKNKASSDKVYQQAEADYKTNNILISGLQQKLELIGINTSMLRENNISRTVSVRAPIDGFVSKVNANIGRYVNPSDVLFELVNPSDIHLALTVFEKDLNKVFIGQKLLAYPNNDTNRKYPCTIILVGKDITNERSVQVHCHFEKYDGSLVPGMFMNAELKMNESIKPVLPESAIVNFKNKQYIFISKGSNYFQMKEVIIGSIENGMVAIESAPGIDIAKEKIVTANAYALLMKLKNAAE